MKLEKKTLLSLLGIALSVVLFAWLLNNWDTFVSGAGAVLSLIFPILLGFCIAFVLNIPMRFFEKRMFQRTKRPLLQKLRRPLCIVIALLVILVILTAVVLLVVPELLNAFGVLAKTVPVFFDSVVAWAMNTFENSPDLTQWLNGLEINWEKMVNETITILTNGASSLLSGTVNVVVGIAGGLTNTVIAFIVAIYILIGKETLRVQASSLLRAILPEKYCQNVFFVTNLTKRTFANFVTGQCTEACILGSLCWLGMLLFRFPYAPMVGALVGITALIPIVGAFIGMVVGAFMIMMINPLQAVWFVIFLLCLQQIEGNVIYPRVVGSSVGLPGLWVLVAVTLGGNLMGIVGMLFAVPLCSVLYALTRLAVHARIAAKAEACDAAASQDTPPSAETADYSNGTK